MKPVKREEPRVIAVVNTSENCVDDLLDIMNEEEVREFS